MNTKFIHPKIKNTQEITVIGGGAIGQSVAWHLARLGHEVKLIDPQLNKPIARSGEINGSTASLGVLMGNLCRRSTGRNWKLRQRSMVLWQKWVNLLSTSQYPLNLKTPLVRLANSEKEANYMKQLAREKKIFGIELLRNELTTQDSRLWPSHPWGGLISHRDGRIDPINLQYCLLNALANHNVQQIPESVLSLKRGSKYRWKIAITNGTSFDQDTVIICASLGSEALIQPLGHSRPMSPVLGQALKLEIKPDNKNWSGWPSVLIAEGINIIPSAKNVILMGATIEPGKIPDSANLRKMKAINGSAPLWLQESSELNQWSGLRGRPIERAAPLLEQLEPGLILATGHYRNGILLAPVTAEWVGEKIAKDSTK